MHTDPSILRKTHHSSPHNTCIMILQRERHWKIPSNIQQPFTHKNSLRIELTMDQTEVKPIGRKNNFVISQIHAQNIAMLFNTNQIPKLINGKTYVM